MHVAAMKPVALSSDDVPAELIEKERIASPTQTKAAEVAASRAEIVAKRVEGSVQKYLKEVSLLNQPFVKNDKQTVEQMLKAANTTVKGFTLYVVGEGIEKKVDDFAAEVAAQVAAAKQAALKRRASAPRRHRRDPADCSRLQRPDVQPPVARRVRLATPYRTYRRTPRRMPTHAQPTSASCSSCPAKR